MEKEVPVLHLCSAVWRGMGFLAWGSLKTLVCVGCLVSCVQLHHISQESLRIQWGGWADLFESVGMFRPVHHCFSGHVTTDTEKWSARNQGIFFPTECKAWKTTGWGWSSGLLESCVSFWLPGVAGFCQEYWSLQCYHQMKIAIFCNQIFV